MKNKPIEKNNELQQQLIKFASHYPNTAKLRRFIKFNKENPEYQLMTDQIPKSFNKQIRLPNLKIKGSVGKGQWALVPWLAFFDTRISDTATKGFDIVFLFSTKFDYLFLSFNQGWTFYKDYYGTKKGKKKISQVSAYLREKLNSIPKKTEERIDLQSLNNLPKGYELGNIAAFKYDLHHLPNDATILNNIDQLYDCLNELRAKFPNCNFEQIINIGLNASVDVKKKTSPKASKKAVLDFLKQNIDHMLLEEESKPHHTPTIEKTSYVQQEDTPYTPNYLEQEMEKSELGLFGEKLVLKFEKDKVCEKDKTKIEHTSIIHGDGLGYDIKSLDQEGHPLFIEVKTTLGDKNRPFHLSLNEYQFAKTHPQNYLIYRVFKKSNHMNQFGFFKLTTLELLNHCQLSPENFLVTVN